MKPSPHDRIDLAASAARVQSARKLAKAQALHVEAAAPHADRQSIDLLYTLQESVLVLSQTHALLKEIAASEAPKIFKAQSFLASPETALCPAISRAVSTDTTVQGWRHAPVLILTFVLALIAASAAIEVVDPQPMDAEAAWIAVQ